MRHLPSPPVVSAAVSGFVIGVFVTLAANGVFAHATRSSGPPSLPTPISVPGNTLQTRLSKLVKRTLGSYTSDRHARVVSIQLTHVHSIEPLTDPVSDLGTYRSVYIVFRLNDHPLGPSWRVKAAKADVFALMKAIYTSALPIYDTQLIGRFPLRSGKRTQITDAVVAYETHTAALHVPWKRWGRENEALLWNELSYRTIDPRFG